MKCKYDKPVQWKNNDTHLTGVLVLTETGECITSGFGVIPDGNHEQVLVAHSFTRELEFVAWHLLSNYPAEAIPQPSRKIKALAPVRSQRQVAEHLGIALRTVQETEARAMKKIRAAIEKRAKRKRLTVLEWLFETEEFPGDDPHGFAEV